MSIPKHLTKDPYSIADPKNRWTPEISKGENKDLLPPLVKKIRLELNSWRKNGYAGASKTSKALLLWWFEKEHSTDDGFFCYYFAQRESVEAVIYMYEVKGCRKPSDLILFHDGGALRESMFKERWLRLVCKQATGTGKTKVLSLLLAWAFFHKKYESGSDLSTNFLLIAPNIIVLDRLKSDFESLKIFSEDPIIPENGYEEKEWKHDFNLTVHIQDELMPINPNGNIFLTNIHRVYSKDETEPSDEDENTTDYYLGKRPTQKKNKYKLSKLLRNLDDLIIFNDEAHHIHDESLVWFKEIENIHNNLLHKGNRLSLQIDVTATPKDANGKIFPQIVSDYPLVEAIWQGIVKTPYIPNNESQLRLKENDDGHDFATRYAEYLELGYEEWKKTSKKHFAVGKKPILFIMVDDTKNCDSVKRMLEDTYIELKGKIFVIHTKNNGEIAETQTSKKETELKELRKIANSIDSMENNYNVIISVLMLKEGWDVKNVTTIVGLRAYSSKSNILPEQTLGRGLRKMYLGPDQDVLEPLSVIGTDHFLEFIKTIKKEGVVLEDEEYGTDKDWGPMPIEVDLKKNIKKLDIEIPIMEARIKTYYKNLENLKVEKMVFVKQKLVNYNEEQIKKIIFEDLMEGRDAYTTEIKWKIQVDANFIVHGLLKKIFHQQKLYNSPQILYGKIRHFIRNYLFGKKVDLDDKNLTDNLKQPFIRKVIIDAFNKAIINLPKIQGNNNEKPNFVLQKVSDTTAFLVNNQPSFLSEKTIFNKLVGDSKFEMDLIVYLDKRSEIKSFIKCFRQIKFKINYFNSDGNRSTYCPDFIVKLNDESYYVIEAKGDVYVNADTTRKQKRLKKWCEEASKLTGKSWGSLYILESKWKNLNEKPQSFKTFVDLFGVE